MELPPEGLVLNIFKPAGITSFDVVRNIRRRLRVKKVGHTGTLDPMAEGVLIILVGKATKRAEEFSALDKTYQAGILLGRETDTYDITGKIAAESDCAEVNFEQIESSLREFLGDTEQIPPMFSAIKKDGRKLYQLARKGIEIEREPRKIKIFNIEIRDFQPPHLRISVHCSKGTYIRSLAHDLGRKLGCGACLESLVRTAVGNFKVEDSISLEDIENHLIAENILQSDDGFGGE